MVAGIGADKIARYEGWGSRRHDPSASAAQVIDRLAALEGKLQITVERTPPEGRETRGRLYDRS